MRVRRFLLPSLLLILTAVWPALGTAHQRSASAKPLTLRPHWRVALPDGFRYAAANDRYVALTQGSAQGLRLVLIDEQAGTQSVLSPHGCDGPNDLEAPPIFGGPWLMVWCGSGSSPSSYQLYNLGTGQWTAFMVSSGCRGSCTAIAVGRYWVKIATDEGFVNHSPQDYYLQNIQSGQFIRDPVKAGGRTFDDLDAPSGTKALCTPLRYPWGLLTSAGGWQPGLLTMYGQFALTIGGESPRDATGNYHLLRCHSKVDLTIPNSWPPTPPLPASSRAVDLTTNGKTISGWLLPSLQPLSMYPPAQTQTRVCGGGERNGVIPLAVTTRNIYIRALCGTQTVWVASLPSPSGTIAGSLTVSGAARRPGHCGCAHADERCPRRGVLGLTIATATY
jgi:hypothetical protein